MTTLGDLALAITPSQATSIAASLEIDGRLDYAVSALPNGSHPAVALLDEAVVLLGGVSSLAAVLRGFAAAGSKSSGTPRAVWSGPSFQGDSDHTTAAIAHLIDQATEDVFASTFSATSPSPFIDALWRAIARGVSVTVLVEMVHMKSTLAALQRSLVGATFLGYVAPAGEYGIQHSKVVLVDSSIAFVTSANFSDAAAHRNLETGVTISDPDFATKVRQRFRSLKAHGFLVDL